MTAALIPHPAASRHAFRAQVCRLVDRLIAMLDEIDGDADLEPSIAFSEVAHFQSQAYAAKTAPIGGPEWTDIEESCEGEGEACEDEGAEHDGREPDEDNDTSDYEASLCGVRFGAGSSSGLDSEATTAAFVLDQTEERGP